MEEFKYLGTTLINQYSIQEEIKSRLKSGNACYHSGQNLLSSSLLPKNIKIDKYNFPLIDGGRMRLRWARHVACTRDRKRCIQGFGGETYGKRPLGRPRRRWEDNIKTDLQDVGCEGMDRIDLAQERGGWRALVNVEINFRFP